MKRVFYDDEGFDRVAGEIWFDKTGNECYFRKNGTINVTTVNNEPSMTIQSEKDKCDIEIIKQIYAKSGVMNNIRTDQPRYGDFTSSRELHDVILRAQEAQEDFMLLDAHIRARFENDPGKLLDFVADPKNASEAVKLGLMKDLSSSPQAFQVPQGEAKAPSDEGA